MVVVDCLIYISCK